MAKRIQDEKYGGNSAGALKKGDAWFYKMSAQDARVRYSFCASCGHSYTEPRLKKFCSSSCQSKHAEKDAAGREVRLASFLSKLSPEQRAKYGK
jgi:hypothetical protein